MPNWDREIDEVARQMTESTGSVGFTGRVLARIEDGAPGRSRWQMWVWSPAVAATAAVAALLAWAPWQSNEVRLKPDTTTERVRPKPDNAAALDPRPLAASNPDSVVASGANSIVASGDNSVVASGFSRTSVARSFSRTIRRSNPSAEIAQVSELAPPPLEIDPIGVDSMETMESIDVPRLAVAELEVPAIGDAQ